MTAPNAPLIDAFRRRYLALLGDTLTSKEIERLLLHVFLLSSDDLIIACARTLTEQQPRKKQRS
ncbi:hypothetical protein [Deinococcus yavapaiensis]|uniref:Uncharacterized protein n=1 Tax=Deinococcus yavapaiensis KR-236 TaxID=694435 RepID=A0A318S3M0_9DEIO|nr:hypothetical protein [Deinococcus yavapaiensis]PYE51047.1 hypothetical protein DES52_116114 [Deinococcus yavapaiensis KR-236]